MCLVKDPLGNEVLIVDKVYNEKLALLKSDYFLRKDEGVLDIVKEIIEKPGLVIEKKTGPKSLFYFRGITWDVFVLLETVFMESCLTTTRMIIDPGMDYINTIFQNGKILLD